MNNEGNAKTVSNEFQHDKTTFMPAIQALKADETGYIWLHNQAVRNALSVTGRQTDCFMSYK